LLLRDLLKRGFFLFRGSRGSLSTLDCLLKLIARFDEELEHEREVV
jgi:hypothetical protein